MQKKGISAIVATVLIILITVAAVTIIWAAVIPMITQNLDFEDPNMRFDIVTSGGYTFWDEDDQKLYVQVKRGTDEVEVVGLQIILTIYGDSFGKSYGLNQVPGSNQAKTIIIGGVAEKPESVKVVPIIKKGRKVVNSSYSSETKINDGNAVVDMDVTPTADEEVSGSPAFFSSLISWWEMEEDAGGSILDSKGSNDGAITGEVSIVDGKVGDAMGFDGSGDYIQVINEQNFDFGTATDFSIAGWVKISSSGANMAFFTKQDFGGSTLRNRIIYSASTGQMEMRIGTAGGVMPSLVAGPSLVVGQWYHVAGVFDRSENMTLYINGIKVGSIGISGVGDVNNNIPVLIGAQYSPYPTINIPWNGSLDEVMVFGKALSSEEVQELYNLQSA